MQIAGLRGLVVDPTKVDLAKVVTPASDAPVEPAASAGPARVVAAADAAGLRAWQDSGELVRDGSRAVYRYHQVFAADGRTLTRKLLLAAVKLAPWAEGTVRAHEVVPAALRDAELVRLRATGVQVMPLLGGFRDAAGEVDRLLKRAEAERPILEVTTPDGTLHRIWRERRAEVLGSLRPLFAPKKLTLLEGHARYDALLAYSDELAASTSYAASNYALMALVALDDPTLQLRGRHRVVRGTLVPAAVLEAARRYFLVEPIAGAARDAAKLTASLAETLMHLPAFVVAFAGDPNAYKLTLSPDVSPVAEGVKVHRAVQKLDPIVVEELFVGRAMPGVTTTGELDPVAALAQLDPETPASAGALQPRAGASAVIIQRALTLEQITHVAELGQALPAGSSAFHPQVVAGLVLHVLDPNEDLV